MKLGWVDYSKEDKRKALEILDVIYEPGTLDELGFAPIRDAFANEFFPGITTIQTRAKYFLSIPYALIELKEQIKNKSYGVNSAFNELFKIENTVCRNIYETSRKEGRETTGEGNIGADNLRGVKDPEWITRKPSEIYWAGLQKFGIIKAVTRVNLIGKICYINDEEKRLEEESIQNKEKSEYKRNFNDEPSDDINAEIIDRDYYIDTDLLSIYKYYKEDWKKNLKLEIEYKEERDYLYKKITSSFPKSLLTTLMTNPKLYNNSVLINGLTYDSIGEFIKEDEELYKKYLLSKKFDELQSSIKLIYYNLVYNKELKEEFNTRFKMIKFNNLPTDKDIEDMFSSLDIQENNEKIKKLKYFIHSCNRILTKDKENLINEEYEDDLKELEQLIIERENTINRAKQKKNKINGTNVNNPQFNNYKYDYRFSIAKVIINDIIGENKNVKSLQKQI